MKKLLPFLSLLLWSGVSWAQTGTGVVLLTEDSFTFTPTTVDSTTVFNLQLKNTVGVPQTIFFGGLDAPFELSSNLPIELASQDTLDFSIAFTPEAVGTFSDTLEVLGSIFGEAALVVSGDGIQVNFEWSPDTLNFNTTPIGQTDTQIVELSSIGDGAAVIGNFQFSNDIFSVDSAGTDFEIAEGESGTLSITFAPTGAGVFDESVTFETNDPNNQFVTLLLQATSISEVSGDVCNVTWSLADSPFTLVDDVNIPESCTLTVEAGTEIITNGYTIHVIGDIELVGTENQPISIVGGQLNYESGEASSIEHVVFSEGAFDAPLAPASNGDYVLVYRNDFEDSNQQYDFNCYQYRNNNYYTGSNTGSGSYGCDDFYRDNSSSWSLQSNTGDHYLRYYSSSGGNGFLYLETPPTAPEAGYYEFSFTYESDRYERECFMTIDVEMDGRWHEKYRSPIDIESNSTLTRLARAFQYFEEGEEMNFRIKHHNAVASGDWDQMYSYIDEVRIEKVRAFENRVDWDFENNANDFSANSNGFHGNEPRVALENGILSINSYETTINFNTTNWAQAPIIVPADGWYYVSIENKLIEASRNANQYVEYAKNNGSWRRVVDNPTLYGYDMGAETYDWREDVVHGVDFFEAGDRIDFRFYGNHWTTEGQTDWETRRISIYQLSESESSLEALALGNRYPAQPGIVSQRDMNVSLSNIPYLNLSGPTEVLSLSESSIPRIEIESSNVNISMTDMTTETLNVTGVNTDIQIDNSAIDVVKNESGTCELTNSDVESLLSGIEIPSIETPSVEVYSNNFVDVSRHYEFDCYDYRANQFVTGTTTSYGSYGCNNFAVNSSSSWSYQSNSDDYYLYFYSSNGGDAYLVLDEDIVAPMDGFYEFSFTYESDRYENNCYMTIDVLVDDYWETIYKSPLDIEGNSNHTRLAKGEHYFDEGEVMTFRIRHHNNVSSSNSEWMYTYIDNVRIGSQSNVVNVAQWNFDDNASDFNSVTNDYGNHGNEKRVQLYGDTLRINSWETTINFNTQAWSNAPILVPSSGWYYIELDNRLISSCGNAQQYVQYSRNSGSWYDLVQNTTRYGADTGSQPYDWRKDIVAGRNYFNQGDRIDFRFYGNYWTTSGQTDWEVRNIRIYQLNEVQGAFPIEMASSASVSLDISDCEMQSVLSSVNTTAAIQRTNIEGSGSDGLGLYGSENSISLEHSVIASHANRGIYVAGENGHLHLGNSIISDNTSHGIETSNAIHQLEYLTIANNGGVGLMANDNGPTSIQNSILSNNDNTSYIADGVLTEYNYFGSYPQFQEGSYHLELYSPAVDAGMPWHTRAYAIWHRRIEGRHGCLRRLTSFGR